MKESLSNYIRSKSAEPFFERLNSLDRPFAIPVKLFVNGPRHSSKTTFMHAMANDAQEINPQAATVFACSGADIAIALQFEADDAFFERLGSVPIVIIDDPAPLLSHEKGAQLLDLMIKQRDSVGASTIILSDTAFDELDFGEASSEMREFEVFEFAPLDADERAQFLRAAEATYRTDASPEVTDDAIALLVEHMGDSFTDMENAMRYLMVDEDCAALGTIDVAATKQLFEL